MSRSCINCASPINTLRSHAKFCSPACRVSHHRVERRSKVLPAEMVTATRWVRHDSRKRPLSAVDGRMADWQLPSSWTTYEGAKRSPHGVGIGFVLGAGIGCWDLDHCITDGVLDSWAAEVIAGIEAPLWVERSMSGDGVHIFVRSEEAPAVKIRDGRNIEFYAQGRYIAVTEDRLEV
jgi:primase-polymerase (primpol)-like protein